MSRHTGSCATAITPGCACPCLHARHGLEGRLHWALALSVPVPRGAKAPPEREEAEKRQSRASGKLDERIKKARKSKRSRGLSQANSTAALEYARTVALTQWLVEHPSERSQLTSIVTIFVKASTDLVEKGTDKKRNALKRRIRDHLWCDLIASVVCAIEQVGALEAHVKAELEVVIAESATRLLKSARSAAVASPAVTSKDGKSKSKADADAEAGLSMDSAIIQGCIKGVVGLALDGATAGLDAYLKVILAKLRIAAVMLCPDIIKHRLVWKHCWLPLWNAALLDAALNELAQFVPALRDELPAAA